MRTLRRRLTPRLLLRNAALATLVLSLVTQVARAQHGSASTPPVATAPKEATQFDFLVGQWELVVTPQTRTLVQKLHGMGRLAGTWKGWRALDGWGIEDELRITDRSGNPILYNHAVRFFDRANHRWRISSIDVYRSVVSTSTAEAHTDALVVSGEGSDQDGKAYVSRATFFKITPSSFTYRLDRSFDGGKTWSEGITNIEAKRVAATASR